jgi:hypothetical protein
MEPKSKMAGTANKEHGNNIYNDEMLIEWIKTFSRRVDMRTENQAKYTACLRRGLDIYFPPKRTKSGLIVGEKEELAKRTEKKRDKREEKKRLQEEKKKIRQEKAERDKETADRGKSGPLYPSFYIGEIKTCVRCRIKKPYAGLSLCNTCNNEVGRLIRSGLDHTPGNIKDEFCRTRIKMENGEVLEFEYSATFEQIQTLFRNGYGFILKPRKTQ